MFKNIIEASEIDIKGHEFGLLCHFVNDETSASQKLSSFIVDNNVKSTTIPS